MDAGKECYNRFCQGDDSGLTQIIRDYKDGLIFYLNSYVQNIDTAEELAEDIFVKLAIRKPRFGGRSSFKTWLYAVGRNMALDYLRHSRKIMEVPLDDCNASALQADPEQNFLAQEGKISLYKAMNMLKAEYRQILWLIYFEGFKTKEVAAILRKRPHAVETLTYRAKKALKIKLEKEGFVYENL